MLTSLTARLSNILSSHLLLNLQSAVAVNERGGSTLSSLYISLENNSRASGTLEFGQDVVFELDDNSEFSDTEEDDKLAEL